MEQEIDAQNQEPEINQQDQQMLQGDINQLQYQIIWELETFKKSETAKFKLNLKQQEVDYLTQLKDDWAKKDLEKEKEFKRSEAQIRLLDKQLKQKANELQKREQRLILLEEELKSRINDVSRQIQNKDDEIILLKKKYKDEKSIMDKEHQVLEKKLAETREQLKYINEEFNQFKKDQAASPVTLVKNELNQKNNEIRDLKKENENLIEIKNQYKEYYEKMRKELIKLKSEQENQRLMVTNQTEVEQLKLQLTALQMQQDQQRLTNLKSEMNDWKRTNTQPQQTQQQQMSQTPSTQQFQMEDTAQLTNQNSYNPFKQNLYDQYYQSSNFKENTNPNQIKVQSHYQAMKKESEMTELERLINERENLLAMGDYSADDPLIIELNKQIAQQQAY